MDVHNAPLEQLQEKGEADLKSEEEIEEKKTRDVLEVESSLSPVEVVERISNLTLETGEMLTQISDKLEDEVNKLKDIQKIIEIKGRKPEDMYEIEKAVSTLAALIETQNRKRQEIESEMVRRREELIREIEKTRSE
jgi:hypothetical protein